MSEGIISKLWIAPDVLRWRAKDKSGITFGSDDWRRAYELLAHAEGILADPKTALHRVDAITTLKRAADHRIRQLSDIYLFERIPLRSKPKRTLELLEYLGIVRRNLLLQLIQIRNRVEHADAAPPEQERCLEFAEVVWYFLRSTDLLVHERVEKFRWEPIFRSVVPPRFEVQVQVGHRDTWDVFLEGWLPPSLYAHTATPDWLEVDANYAQTLQEIREGKAWEGREQYFAWLEALRFEADDLNFQGVIAGPEALQRQFYIAYFSIL